MRELTLEEYLQLEQDPAHREFATQYAVDHHFYEYQGRLIVSGAWVNGRCKEYYLEHDYIDHCDHPVIVWPHFTGAHGILLHSYPPAILVAHNCTDGYGYEPVEGAMSELRHHGFSEELCSKVSKYLAAHAAIHDGH